MKKPLLFVLFAALYSCQAISILQNQKITLATDKVSFDPSQKLLYIPAQINQKTTQLAFDTGAMFSGIFSAESICPNELKYAKRFGSVFGADHKKQAQKLVVLPVSSPLFNSENKVFAAVNMQQSVCKNPENRLQGVYGMDLFFHQEKALSLSFSTSCMQLLTNADAVKKANEEGYMMLSSTCKRNTLLVSAKIENKPFWFKLDSGFEGTMAVPYSSKNNFQNRVKTSYDGSAFQTAMSRTYGHEVFYSKMPFVLGEFTNQQQCVESSSIKYPLLGIRFMRGFDWIFDFKNKKIYAKRNGLQIPETYTNLFPYQTEASDKLRISLKAVHAKSFRLGDEILAVNGQKVTAENRCEMQRLLNSTLDWGQLELVVSGSN
ncbi:MAG: hypothetical protein FGM16_01375 [Flavobacterium sp.]|nr:hypothetical protein [Flavobacterium sp.]